MNELESRWFHFRAKGHPNVRATHRTTIEITREESLTPRGDCIIGVSSEASANDLPPWLKERIRSGHLVVLVLCAGNICDSVIGHGSPQLTLKSTVKMIIRRSGYVEPSTIMLESSKAARDLRRDLVEALSQGQYLDVYITTLNLGLSH